MQDYETFFDAKEDNCVYAFLGLPPPPGSKVRTLFHFLLSFLERCLSPGEQWEGLSGVDANLLIV